MCVNLGRTRGYDVSTIEPGKRAVNRTFPDAV